MKKLHKILFIILLFTFSFSANAQTDHFRIVDDILHLPVFENTDAVIGMESGAIIYSRADQMAMIFNGINWDNLCSVVTSITSNVDYFRVFNKIPYMPISAFEPISAEVGSTFYSTNQLTTLVFDGNDWVKIGDMNCSSTSPDIYAKLGVLKFPALSANPLGSNISEGALYINTVDNIFKVFDGANWIEAVSCGWIEFLSPIAGDEWINNTIHEISWTATPDGTTYDVSYSVDGGTTWVNLINDTPSFSYDWNTAGILAYENDVKIKIHDDFYDFDAESSVFEIYPPFSVSIIRNGNGNGAVCENMDPGSFDLTIIGGSGSRTIQWYEDNDSDLLIDATTVGTGLLTYDLIGIEVTYSGTDHLHYIGAIVSDDNLNNVSQEVEVNFDFVTSCLEITSPLAATEWVNNTAQTISWLPANSGTTYDIYWSIDDGITWTSIAFDIIESTYVWTPSIIAAYNDNVKIKIHDDFYDIDITSDAFKVYPPFDVVLARSGSGPVCESIDPGSFELTITGGSGNQTIKWYEDNDNDLADDATLINGVIGTIYNPTGVETSYLGNTHIHYIGAIVRDDNLTNIYHEVEDGFSFESACLEIIAPLADTEWLNNINQTISWTETLIGLTYDLFYSIDGGLNWLVIDSDVTGGSYSWIPSSILTYENDVKIKIHDDMFNHDVISDLFKVYQPFIVVLNRTDNPGDICENLDPGSFEITVTGGSGTYTTQWYEDDDDDLSTDATEVGTGANSYDPSLMHADYNSLSHNHFTGVIVVDTDLTNVSLELEHGYFYGRTCLELTNPLGGEVWINNIPQIITWINPIHVDGTNTYNLDYSIDGINWNSITSGINTLNYEWILDDYITTFSSTVQVRLTDNITAKQNICGEFTVHPPFIVSIERSVNTGDICEDHDPGKFDITVTGGSGSYSVQWYEDDDNDLSLDATEVGTGANTYNPSLMHDDYNDMSHNHYTGAIVTDNNIVGLSFETKSTYFYGFTCLELTNPIGGEEWVANLEQTISWMNPLHVDGTTTYKLEYTLDGTNWILLGDNISSLNYYWTPENDFSTFENQVQLKLTDINSGIESVCNALTVYKPLNLVLSNSETSGMICGNEDPGSYSASITGGSGDYTIHWYEDDDNDFTADATLIVSDVTVYDPALVHSFYSGTNHTHYTGVIVTDNVLTDSKVEQKESYIYSTSSCFAFVSPQGGDILETDIFHNIQWKNSSHADGLTTYTVTYLLNGVTYNELDAVCTTQYLDWTPASKDFTAKIKVKDNITGLEIISEEFAIIKPIEFDFERYSGTSTVLCNESGPGRYRIKVTGGGERYKVDWYEDDDNNLYDDALFSSTQNITTGASAYKVMDIMAEGMQGYEHTYYFGAIVTDLEFNKTYQFIDSFQYQPICFDVIYPSINDTLLANTDQLAEIVSSIPIDRYRVSYNLNTNASTYWRAVTTTEISDDILKWKPATISVALTGARIKVADYNNSGIFAISDTFHLYDPITAILARADVSGGVYGSDDPGRFRLYSIKGGSGDYTVKWYDDDNDDPSDGEVLLRTDIGEFNVELNWDPNLVDPLYNYVHNHNIRAVITDNVLTDLELVKEISFSYVPSGVAVVSPLSGEAYANNEYVRIAIMEPGARVRNPYKIEFSIDGGTNWTTYTAGYNLYSDGSSFVSWRPTGSSILEGTVIVRVSRADDLTITATSEPFTVYKPINFAITKTEGTTPICGNSDPGRWEITGLTGGSGDFSIQWLEGYNYGFNRSTALQIGDDNLIYNPDKVSDGLLNSTTVTNQVYYAAIVTDNVYNGASMYKYSSYYKYYPSCIEFDYPLGNEIFEIDNDNEISWSNDVHTAGTTYALEYSIDDGALWQLIADDITTTNYNWKPEPAITEYQPNVILRITDNIENNFSISNSFSIAKLLKLQVKMKDNSGTLCENDDPGSFYLTVTGGSGDYSIQWYEDYDDDLTDGIAVGSGTHSYNPSSISDDFKSTNHVHHTGVIVTDNIYTGVESSSTVSYNYNTGCFYFIAPFADDKWINNETQTVRWNNPDHEDGVSNYTLQVSTNGSTWTELTNNATGLSYSWLPSDNYMTYSNTVRMQLTNNDTSEVIISEMFSVYAPLQYVWESIYDIESTCGDKGPLGYYRATITGGSESYAISWRDDDDNNLLNDASNRQTTSTTTGSARAYNYTSIDSKYLGYDHTHYFGLVVTDVALDTTFVILDSAIYTQSCFDVIYPTANLWLKTKQPHTIKVTDYDQDAAYNLYWKPISNSGWTTISTSLFTKTSVGFDWSPSAVNTASKKINIKVANNRYPNDIYAVSDTFNLYDPITASLTRYDASGAVFGSDDPGRFYLYNLKGGSGDYSIDWYEDDNDDLTDGAKFIRTDNAVFNGNTTYDPNSVASEYNYTHNHYVRAVIKDNNIAGVQYVKEVLFTYVPGDFAVSSPLGGDIYASNGYVYTRVLAPGTTTSKYYKVECTYDGGLNWTTLIASTSLKSDGANYYRWRPYTTPGFNETRDAVQIRVTRTDDATITATTDSFVVYAVIDWDITHVIKPDAVCGNSDPGKWEISNLVGGSGDYSIQWYEASRNNFVIATEGRPVGDGSLVYDPVQVTAELQNTVGVTTNVAKAVVITDNVYTGVSRTLYCATTFSYDPSCMEFTEPFGGEFYGLGTANTISWTNSIDADETRYTLDYSIDGGLTWSNIDTNIDGLIYNWIPSPEITEYQPDVILRVIESILGNEALSNSVSIIEELIVGITHNVNLNIVCENSDPGSYDLSVTGGSGNYTVQWYEDDDDDLSTDASIVGDGSLTYDPTSILAAYNSVNHTHYTGVIVTDNTYTGLSVEKEVNYNYNADCFYFIEPFAGDIWINNEVHTVSWNNPTHVDGTTNYTLEVSTDGINWTELTNSESNSSYNWLPSAQITSYQTAVRMRLTDNNTSEVISSEQFTVYTPMVVSLSTSFFNENICNLGDPGNFKLTITGGSNAYDIQWYEDDDSDLSSDATAVGNVNNVNHTPTSIDEAYQGTEHTHYIGAIVSDRNLDLTFEIDTNVFYTPDCFEITYPTAGALVAGGPDMATITYTPLMGSTRQQAHYRTSATSSWVAISSTELTNALTWVPPVITAINTNVQVKVQDYYNPSLYAISEPFTLYPAIKGYVSRQDQIANDACSDEDPGRFVIAYLGGGSGDFTIQWYEDDDDDIANGATPVGTNSTEYNPIDVPLEYRYPHTHYITAVVTDNNIAGAQSIKQKSFVYSNECFAITYPLAGDTFLNNGNINIHFYDNTYQWTVSKYTLEFTTNGTDWNTIATGITSLSQYWLPSVITSYQDAVQLRLTDENDISRVAVSELFTVYTPLNANWSRTDVPGIYLCGTQDPGSFEITNPTGGSGDYSAKWYVYEGSTFNEASATLLANTSLTYDPSEVHVDYKDLPDGSQYRIRAILVDNVLGLEKLVAEQVFTYNSQCLVITTSLEGEVWRSNANHTLQWKDYSGGSNYRIEYSIDDGLTWDTRSSINENSFGVTGSTSNGLSTYSYNYNLVYLITTYETNVRLRVVNNSNNLYDITDTFTVYSPFNMEIIRSIDDGICVSNDPGSFNLNITGGSGDYTIQWRESDNSNIAASGVNVGTGGLTYDPSSIDPAYTSTSHTHYVGVTINDNIVPLAWTQVSVNFTVATECLEITAPVMGDIWLTNSHHSIIWNEASGATTYDLTYSKDNGLTWNSIVSGISGSSYSWRPSVINTYENDVIIKIKDNAHDYIVKSDVFTVCRPLIASLTRTESEGGCCEDLDPGNFNVSVSGGSGDYTIKWFEDDDDPLTDPVLVATDVTNYNPTLMHTNFNTYDHMHKTYVEVTDNIISSFQVSDEADYLYTISCLEVVNPTEGQVVPNHNHLSYSWRSTAHINDVTTYKVEHSLDNGITWNTIISDYSAYTDLGNVIIYNWIHSVNVLSGYNPNSYIRVTDNNTGKIDVSNKFIRYDQLNAIITRSEVVGDVCGSEDPGLFTLTSISGGSGEYDIEWKENNIVVDASLISNDGRSYNPITVHSDYLGTSRLYYVTAKITDRNIPEAYCVIVVSVSFLYTGNCN